MDSSVWGTVRMGTARVGESPRGGTIRWGTVRVGDSPRRGRVPVTEAQARVGMGHLLPFRAPAPGPCSPYSLPTNVSSVASGGQAKRTGV